MPKRRRLSLALPSALAAPPHTPPPPPSPPIGVRKRSTPGGRSPSTPSPALDVLVFGSINLDYVTTASKLPAPGETVQGTSFALYNGGKGANTAVAGAKLGGQVALVGHLGSADPAGGHMLDSLKSMGLDCSHVTIVPGLCGSASVTVGPQGENTVVVIPGANAAVSPSTAKSALGVIRGRRPLVVCLQNEVPFGATAAMARLASLEGVPYICWNPSPLPPAFKLPDGVNLLVVNEDEALAIHRLVVKRHKKDAAPSLAQAAEALYKALRIRLVITRGVHGCFIFDNFKSFNVPAFDIADPVVDTTGAGDCFAGALALALARAHRANNSVLSDIDFCQCVHFANRAAAVSVTRPGAQASYPSALELETAQVKPH